MSQKSNCPFTSKCEHAQNESSNLVPKPSRVSKNVTSSVSQIVPSPVLLWLRGRQGTFNWINDVASDSARGHLGLSNRHLLFDEWKVKFQRKLRSRVRWEVKHENLTSNRLTSVQYPPLKGQYSWRFQRQSEPRRANSFDGGNFIHINLFHFSFQFEL